MDGEETFLFLSNRRDREPNPDWKKLGVAYFSWPAGHAAMLPIHAIVTCIQRLILSQGPDATLNLFKLNT